MLARWNRPLTKLPLLAFLFLIVMCCFGWEWPAAPIGVLTGSLAWILRPYPQFVAKAARTTLWPIITGISLFCATAFLINNYGVNRIKSAQQLESTIIHIAYLLQPIADPNSAVLWIAAASLLVVSFLLNRWDKARLVLQAQKAMEWVYFVLAVCLCFSFFSDGPVEEIVREKVAAKRDFYLQARISFQKWSERNYRVALVYNAFKAATDDNFAAWSDLTNAASVVQKNNKDWTGAKIADLWFDLRFNPTTTAAPSHIFPIPFLPLPEEPEFLRRSAENPVWSGNLAGPKRSRLPSPSEWSEAREVTGRLSCETETLERNVATRTEALRCLLNDVVETGMEKAGAMPVSEFAKQLTKRLVDSLAEKLPVGKPYQVLETRINAWIASCQRPISMPTDKLSLQSNTDSKTGRRLLRMYINSQLKVRISNEEFRKILRTIREGDPDKFTVCANCHLPMWFPRCPAAP
jgi:hypothetical protein